MLVGLEALPAAEVAVGAVVEVVVEVVVEAKMHLGRRFRDSEVVPRELGLY